VGQHVNIIEVIVCLAAFEDFEDALQVADKSCFGIGYFVEFENRGNVDE
jgi:hypothetical protein